MYYAAVSKAVGRFEKKIEEDRTVSEMDETIAKALKKRGMSNVVETRLPYFNRKQQHKGAQFSYTIFGSISPLITT
ncbi:MAG: hypothetical protein GXP60_02780 [Epsilonproteobacteria bacterium]|nr:hypothetical protein [Campylobacterota bacterium]